MALHAIVGLQTGDEGKGVESDRIITDPSLIGLEKEIAAVVKPNGGDDAGHTSILDKEDAMGDKFVAKLYDSGVRYPDIIHIFGSEVVCNLLSLSWELAEIRTRLGHDPLQTTHISEKAVLILPFHRIEDVASEQYLAKRDGIATGTTGRGIRPAYASSTNRNAVRMYMLRDKDTFAKAVRDGAAESRGICRDVYSATYENFRGMFEEIGTKDKRRLDMLKKVGIEIDGDFTRFFERWTGGFDTDRIIDEYWTIGQGIVGHIEDVSRLAKDMLVAGKEILGELSQGYMLDVTEGLAPNVTSARTTSHVLAQSLGVDPRYLKNVVGVAKLYETKVGTHVFPERFTEENRKDLYEFLSLHEFGSVTGRQRMVGALSLPTLRRAVQANGVTHLAINKSDLLAGRGNIPMTGFYLDGEKRYWMTPCSNREFSRCTPVMWEYPGFEGDISSCRSFEELPHELLHAFAVIENDLCNIAPELTLFAAGVGAGRDSYARRDGFKFWNMAWPRAA